MRIEPWLTTIVNTRCGQVRNGTTPKTVVTEVGDVQLDQPRDRNASFTSVLVPKDQRRLGGAEGMIISLYAGGMTIRDIQHHLVATLRTELSHKTISEVTEAVAEEVTRWHARPFGIVLSGGLPLHAHREGS